MPVELRSLNFTYDDETAVDGSCSVIWQIRFYVFGGVNKKRQISELNGCRKIAASDSKLFYWKQNFIL